jgi:pSer/pThr/pTyr-binding forkhead associated (FHA) protein
VAGAVPSGMTWSLSGDSHTIGRGGADVDLVEDPHVNSHHATVERDGTTWTVTDQDSLNGVFVQIDKPHALSDGDFFRVGNQLFRFEEIEDSKKVKDDDGTEFFTSPKRDVKFRVLQILEGGIPGISSNSTSGEVTIGGDGATIGFSSDENLSERHARVFDSGGGKYQLEDLGSTNGTYVRIGDKHPIESGDLIYIGEQLMRADIS